MPVLYTILGIIAFFVLIFSIKIQVNAEYLDEFTAEVKWLFVRVPLYPTPEKKKKPKKEKAKKEKKPKEEKPKEETEKGENKILTMFKNFYENQGFDGVMKLLEDTVNSAEKMGHSFKKHFVFQRLYLWMSVSKNQDAAQTALAYGKLCQKVFPLFGYICSNFPVRKYDCVIEPDFLGNSNMARFAVSFSVRPIFFTNALVAFAFRMLFKVALKFYFKSKPKAIENKNQNNIKQGGASI
ncbi:MAG: DUF2953 domain-containing protein [Clostridiales bacterium]|nr:DUF2953 domain-containing protein [Clostridia bacterium]MCR4563880.1 DUF2953 domain-containing protein [Clostridiales bacterium]